MGVSFKKGFTIVELLIVIVVIAILAAITLVAYNTVTKRAIESSMKSDLESAAKVVGVDTTTNGTYPSSAAAANGGRGLQSSSGTSMTYILTAAGYCIAVSNPKTTSVFSITEQGTIGSTPCPAPIGDGSFIQDIGSGNCPAARTRAVDARDNRTYWVQKLADGRCWMLTNLAYSGGGVNTYGDVRGLTNGTGSTDNYGTPFYAIPPSANVTTNPTAPSTSTDGGATGTQYGYLYNWCAVMGGQATTACANANGLPADASISICPAGWRPATATANGEIPSLNTLINSGLSTTDAGWRATLYVQRSGYQSANTMNGQGSYGYYWTGTQGTPDVNGFPRAAIVYVDSTHFTIYSTMGAALSGALRCIAN